MTGDSGSGDRVGPFQGQVVAVGPLVGYTFKISEVVPVNLEAKWFREFDVRNRFTGDAVFGSISLPLVPFPLSQAPVTTKY